MLGPAVGVAEVVVEAAAAVAAFEQPAHVEQVPVPAFQLQPPLLYVHRLMHTR